MNFVSLACVTPQIKDREGLVTPFGVCAMQLKDAAVAIPSKLAAADLASYSLGKQLSTPCLQQAVHG